MYLMIELFVCQIGLIQLLVIIIIIRNISFAYWGDIGAAHRCGQWGISAILNGATLAVAATAAAICHIE